MEIFKDDKIFSYIDKHALLVNENNAECILKLVGVGEWGENEYTNFINVMKSEDYVENIEKHNLQIFCDDNLLEIVGDTNIIKYSHNPTYIKTNNVMHKYKILAKDECGELFNSKLLFLTTKKQPTSKENIPENWKDLRKFFKINKIQINCQDKGLDKASIIEINLELLNKSLFNPQLASKRNPAI